VHLLEFCLLAFFLANLRVFFVIIPFSIGSPSFWGPDHNKTTATRPFRSYPVAAINYPVVFHFRGLRFFSFLSFFFHEHFGKLFSRSPFSNNLVECDLVSPKIFWSPSFERASRPKNVSLPLFSSNALPLFSCLFFFAGVFFSRITRSVFGSSSLLGTFFANPPRFLSALSRR